MAGMKRFSFGFFALLCSTLTTILVIGAVEWKQAEKPGHNSLWFSLGAFIALLAAAKFLEVAIRCSDSK
jgi:hypothetical protein